VDALLPLRFISLPQKRCSITGGIASSERGTLSAALLIQNCHQVRHQKCRFFIVSIAVSDRAMRDSNRKEKKNLR
jgi:hypothetical protein